MSLPLCFILLATLFVHGDCQPGKDPRAPQNATIEAISPDKVRVSWQPPSEPDGLVVGYIVPWRVVNTTTGGVYYTKYENYTIPNLKPNQTIFAIVCSRIEEEGSNRFEHNACSGEVRVNIPSEKEWERLSTTTEISTPTPTNTTNSGSAQTSAIPTTMRSASKPATTTPTDSSFTPTTSTAAFVIIALLASMDLVLA